MDPSSLHLAADESAVEMTDVQAVTSFLAARGPDTPPTSFYRTPWPLTSIKAADPSPYWKQGSDPNIHLPRSGGIGSHWQRLNAASSWQEVLKRVAKLGVRPSWMYAVIYKESNACRDSFLPWNASMTSYAGGFAGFAYFTLKHLGVASGMLGYLALPYDDQVRLIATLFERNVAEHRLGKLKSLGEAYMCVFAPAKIHTLRAGLVADFENVVKGDVNTAASGGTNTYNGVVQALYQQFPKFPKWHGGDSETQMREMIDLLNNREGSVLNAIARNMAFPNPVSPYSDPIITPSCIIPSLSGGTSGNAPASAPKAP